MFALTLGWLQDWSKATGLARAFNIGPKESQAVYALLCHVPEDIRNRLEAAVKVRGMSRLISHDVIGKGCFNLGWTSASGSTESWSEELTNTSARKVVAPRLQ